MGKRIHNSGMSDGILGMDPHFRGRMVKRAISLPKELDDKLAGLARAKAVSYSSVLRLAAERLLRRLEADEVREAYSRYYAGAGRRQADEGLADELAAASEEAWPEP